MSDAAKAERARRMERWAETAMAKLIEAPRDSGNEAAVTIAKRAWEFAAYMEDQRTSVLSALAGLEPQDPRMPPEKPSWER